MNRVDLQRGKFLGLLLLGLYSFGILVVIGTYYTLTMLPANLAVFVNSLPNATAQQVAGVFFLLSLALSCSYAYRLKFQHALYSGVFALFMFLLLHLARGYYFEFNWLSAAVDCFEVTMGFYLTWLVLQQVDHIAYHRFKSLLLIAMALVVVTLFVPALPMKLLSASPHVVEQFVSHTNSIYLKQLGSQFIPWLMLISIVACLISFVSVMLTLSITRYVFLTFFVALDLAALFQNDAGYWLWGAVSIISTLLIGSVLAMLTCRFFLQAAAECAEARLRSSEELRAKPGQQKQAKPLWLRGLQLLEKIIFWPNKPP